MIRKAEITDADAIVALMLLAMGDLPYQFANSKDKNTASQLLKKFVLQEGNQYSINNVFVNEEQQEIIGAITCYDGAAIERLRQPFFDYINLNYHNGSFEMALETETGEYYIDTLAVDAKHQGKGIGRNLIAAVLDHAKKLGHQKVALLVSSSNPDAKKLYEKIGFVKVGYRYLLGNTHEHLVYQL
jgi:ribosomal protein S18 acetylase RimI-like enzyme